MLHTGHQRMWMDTHMLLSIYAYIEPTAFKSSATIFFFFKEKQHLTRI